MDDSFSFRILEGAEGRLLYLITGALQEPSLYNVEYCLNTGTI